MLCFGAHKGGQLEQQHPIWLIALMSSLMYCYRTISFQSGYSYNNLDQSFVGNVAVPPVSSVNEEFAYYMDKGIDGMLMKYLHGFVAG